MVFIPTFTINMVNVGINTIHGSSGLYNSSKSIEFSDAEKTPNPSVGGPQVEIKFCGEIPMSELVGTNTQAGGHHFFPDGGTFFGVFLGGFLVERRSTFLGVKKVTMTPTKVSSISFLALTATAEVWFGRSCVFFVFFFLRFRISGRHPKTCQNIDLKHVLRRYLDV